MAMGGGGLLTVQTEVFSPRSVTLFIPGTSEVWERLCFLPASGTFVKAFWGEWGWVRFLPTGVHMVLVAQYVFKD